MRKLVSVRKIDNVEPIPNADAIEKLEIDGWEVVAKKGEFQPGDDCVYFEIDSFLPADDRRFHFLAKNGTKKDPSGRERVRLRTIKLRKQISQGLALPLKQFPEFMDFDDETNLDELIDVIKYERPEPKAGEAAGNFPEWIPKTDEERIQNLYGKLSRFKAHVKYTPTLKLDGSSITMIYVPGGMDEMFYEHWDEETELPKAYNDTEGQFQVCSRNMKLKYNMDSHFWKGFMNSQIRHFMKTIAKIQSNRAPIVLQGEIMGPGIQGNREGFTDYRVFIFNMFDVLDQSYITWETLHNLYSVYAVELDVNLVPVLGEPVAVLQQPLADILAQSDGPSINNKIREGVVWKGEDGSSFKSISNQYLLKSET